MKNNYYSDAIDPAFSQAFEPLYRPLQQQSDERLTLTSPGSRKKKKTRTHYEKKAPYDSRPKRWGHLVQIGVEKPGMRVVLQRIGSVIQSMP